MSNPMPYMAMPLWSINEREKREANHNGQPYVTSQTSNYYDIVNRVDSQFIEIKIGRTDQAEPYHTDTRATNYTYIGDYYKREKVYFTFDRITLYELVEIYPAHPEPIRFMLKRLDNNQFTFKGQAFMIMPFSKALDRFYSLVIKSYLKEKHEINIYRADDFRDNDIIVETIYRQIEECEFIVADTTLENKNAFYELGYAAAMRKEIITIQDSSVRQLFFDRNHIRCIFYDPKEIDKFQFDLSSTIQSIRSRQ